MAKTKKVVTNGMIIVSQGQLVATAKIKAADEIKNNIQYRPLDFCLASIQKNFYKNRRAVI